MSRRVPVCRTCLSLACAALVLAPLPAAAQIDDLVERAGVGASVGLVTPFDDDVDTGGTVGFTVGLSPRAGWGLAGSLGWYSGTLELVTASGTRQVGSMQVRPVMGGVGYTWVRARLALSASVTVGVSFNSADVDDDYGDVFGPGTTVDLDVNNSFAVRPAFEVEYAVARKVAVTAWTGVFLTEIDSTLVTPAGLFQDEWNASSWGFSIGVMVYPFR